MRYVIVHADRTSIEVGIAAHAFGPFDSHLAAEAFDAESDDDCVKLIVPVVGPSPFDVLASASDERLVGVSLPIPGAIPDAPTH